MSLMCNLEWLINTWQPDCIRISHDPDLNKWVILRLSQEFPGVRASGRWAHLSLECAAREAIRDTKLVIEACRPEPSFSARDVLKDLEALLEKWS